MPVWIFVKKLKAAVSSKLKIHYSRIPLSVKGPQATWGQNCVSNIPLFHLSLHSQPQQSTEAFSFNQTLHRESAWSRLNLPVVEVVRPRWSACTSWARPSARCTTFGSSICAVFGATTLNPQFMLASRSPRAQWPSSSTGARTKQTHKQKKTPAAFAAESRHADTHRVFGEMLVDGLVLQVVVVQMVFSHAHSSNMASSRPDRSLQINRRTEPSRALRKRWWVTRAAAERIGGPLIEITWDWQRGARAWLTAAREDARRSWRKASTVQGRDSTRGTPRAHSPPHLSLTGEMDVNNNNTN